VILPALPTPMDPSGRPDWGAYQAVMDRLAPEVDGFLVFGSNGEAPLLLPEERRAGLARIRPPKPFLVGVGDESTPQALYHQEAARDAGAIAGLAYLPRFFFAALDESAALRYFEALARVHPVFVYHVPSLTRTELPLPWVKRLAEVPGVQGIKDSSGELARFAYYQAEGIQLRVFTGSAVVFLASLLHGAEGGILAAANLVPRLVRGIFEAYRRGDLAEAVRLQNRLDPLARMLGAGGVVLLKQAMRHLGFPVGAPRPPLPEESPLWPRFLPLLEAAREDGLTP